MKTSEIVKKGSIGVATAIISSVILCAAVAVLIGQEMIPISSAQTVAAIISAITVFLSDWIVVKSVPKSRLPVAMAMGAGYVLLMILLKLAVFPDSAQISGWNFTVPLIVSAVAGIAGSRKSKRRH